MVAPQERIGILSTLHVAGTTKKTKHALEMFAICFARAVWKESLHLYKRRRRRESEHRVINLLAISQLH
jgi:hypothetical protein